MQLGTPSSIGQSTFNKNKGTLVVTTEVLNGDPGSYAVVTLYSDAEDANMLYVEVQDANNGNLILEPGSNSTALELDAALGACAAANDWDETDAAQWWQERFL